MNKIVSIAKAKVTLSDCIRNVEAGSPVLITRHGNPVAALVRTSDFHRLEQLRISPVYDIVNSRLVLPEKKEEMCLSLQGKKNKISKKVFSGCPNILDCSTSRPVTLWNV